MVSPRVVSAGIGLAAFGGFGFEKFESFQKMQPESGIVTTPDRDRGRQMATDAPKIQTSGKSIENGLQSVIVSSS